MDIAQAFRDHQTRSISTVYEPIVNFYSKILKNVIFFSFLAKSHGSNFEVGTRWVVLDLPKNKFVLPTHHMILVFF
jgi:hypothetical protein